jgi:hypothetical protein
MMKLRMKIAFISALKQVSILELFLAAIKKTYYEVSWDKNSESEPERCSIPERLKDEIRMLKIIIGPKKGIERVNQMLLLLKLQRLNLENLLSDPKNYKLDLSQKVPSELKT